MVRRFELSSSLFFDAVPWVSKSSERSDHMTAESLTQNDFTFGNLWMNSLTPSSIIKNSSIVSECCSEHDQLDKSAVL